MPVITNQRGISLTTTGSSGAATYSGGVLNIPNYSGGSMVYPTGTGIAVVTSGTSWGTTLAVNGAGAGVVTGPATSASGDIATFTGTSGQIADSGTLLSNLVKDGSGVITASYIPVSTTTAHTLSYTPTSTYTLSVPTLLAADTVATLGVANTFTKNQTFPASTTTGGSINIPNGAAKTTPAVGDIWTQAYSNNTGLYYYGSTAVAYQIAALNCSNQTWTYSNTFPGVNSTGTLIASGTGAASTYMIKVVNSPYTAGTGTTNFPNIGLVPGATAVTSWSAGGTFIGINAASGFAGNFIDCHTNNSASLFTVNSAGAVTAAGGIGVQVHGICMSDQSNTAYTSSQVVMYSTPLAAAGTIPTGGSSTVNAVAGVSNAYLMTATTASTTFTLYWASSFTGTYTSFGTVVFGAGAQISPTITISSPVSLTVGSIIKVTGPSTADTTAAGLNLTLIFTY